jgi:hypothetical protein
MPIISLMVILENVIDWTMYKKGLWVSGVTNISGGNCSYKHLIISCTNWGRRGRDSMIVGFTSIYAAPICHTEITVLALPHYICTCIPRSADYNIRLWYTGTWNCSRIYDTDGMIFEIATENKIPTFHCEINSKLLSVTWWRSVVFSCFLNQ